MEDYLTPEHAGASLYPEKPDFWRNAQVAELRDSLLDTPKNSPRYEWWEILLEVRLYEEYGITLLDSNGNPRNLETLPIRPLDISL